MIPFVVAPVADPDNQVLITVAFPVTIAKHPGAGFAVAVNMNRRIDLFLRFEIAVEKVGQLPLFEQQLGLPFDIADLGVSLCWAKSNAGLKNRQLLTGFCSRVFEKVKAITGFVVAGNQQIEVAIAVVIDWQWPGPESNTEVDVKSGVVIAQRLQFPIAFRLCGHRTGAESKAQQD